MWHKLPYKSSWCTHKIPPFSFARSCVQSPKAQWVGSITIPYITTSLRGVASDGDGVQSISIAFSASNLACAASWTAKSASLPVKTGTLWFHPLQPKLQDHHQLLCLQYVYSHGCNQSRNDFQHSWQLLSLLVSEMHHQCIYHWSNDIWINATLGGSFDKWAMKLVMTLRHMTEIANAAMIGFIRD